MTMNMFVDPLLQSKNNNKLISNHANLIISNQPKSVCNTHEACLCINPQFTMFTIRSPITVIRLGLRICDWSIKICCDEFTVSTKTSLLCRVVTLLGLEGDCSGPRTLGPPLLIPTAHICETQNRIVHIRPQRHSQAESRGPQEKQAQLDGPAQWEENDRTRYRKHTMRPLLNFSKC